MSRRPIIWRRSSRSDSAGGNCLEATALPSATVAIRDSKDALGDFPRLSIPADDWAGLITTIKAWNTQS
ncbi:uncharacterized protein DUF397 [Stackebrandtia endophytica]|uniref:Uncharacterized protein DUF397 n=1 Tax=Stackebrandtia endophytica TaxID=1496996 RepID=A0A543AY78_9ACTN|nr:DUF397 domain-containing protein [Stackebrandtia endophytica]TQL77526.1 uncharacterized protein DUF397 [Stackebrandtia endophytica]